MGADLALEASLEEVLEEGLRRMHERGTWKVRVVLLRSPGCSLQQAWRSSQCAQRPAAGSRAHGSSLGQQQPQWPAAACSSNLQPHGPPAAAAASRLLPSLDSFTPSATRPQVWQFDGREFTDAESFRSYVHDAKIPPELLRLLPRDDARAPERPAEAALRQRMAELLGRIQGLGRVAPEEEAPAPPPRGEHRLQPGDLQPVPACARLGIPT